MSTSRNFYIFTARLSNVLNDQCHEKSLGLLNDLYYWLHGVTTINIRIRPNNGTLFGWTLKGQCHEKGKTFYPIMFREL